MMQRLRHQQRATYGHHGTSLGKSGRRSPHTVSAMQQESEEARRKKLRDSRLRTSKRPGDKRWEMATEEERKKSAPKHKKQKHAKPGPAPKKRTLEKDLQLEARLAGAGSGDQAAYERSMEAARAQYADVGQKEYTAEEDASFEARRHEYTLDRFAQPTAEEIAEHKRKQELHQQEQQARAKEQETFEKHALRHVRAESRGNG